MRERKGGGGRGSGEKENFFFLQPLLPAMLPPQHHSLLYLSLLGIPTIVSQWRGFFFFGDSSIAAAAAAAGRLLAHPASLWSFAATPSIMAHRVGWAQVDNVIASLCHDLSSCSTDELACFYYSRGSVVPW